jgi:ABC-type Fe3+-hydroxamate transport system substrate-binding protein
MDFTDQCGRKVHLPAFPPRRIISLVPSQTELMFDLGAGDRLVGRTRFCIHPDDKVKKVVRIGGTKDFRMDKIYELKPDLIIGNKEENEKAQIEQLALNFPVWLSDIRSIESDLDMILQVGKMLDLEAEAQAIVNQKKTLYADIQGAFDTLRGMRVVYLIWNNPMMAAGNDTYIHHMLTWCGFENALTDTGRYPVLSEEDLKRMAPDILFLSSEPYPFSEKHLSGFRQWLPSARVVLVDGEFFSWYGSRLNHMGEYLRVLKNQLGILS